jgi:hypothetical protein
MGSRRPVPHNRHPVTDTAFFRLGELVECTIFSRDEALVVVE